MKYLDKTHSRTITINVDQFHSLSGIGISHRLLSIITINGLFQGRMGLGGAPSGG